MNETKWKGRKLLNGMVVNMQHEECITMRFSEGPGIFDRHYGYPEMDDREICEGATGKVTDIQGIHAHAGRNFFVPEGKEFSFDIDHCPYLHITIKAEKDADTCLFLMVHTQKHTQFFSRTGTGEHAFHFNELSSTTVAGVKIDEQ